VKKKRKKSRLCRDQKKKEGTAPALSHFYSLVEKEKKKKKKKTVRDGHER